jgi:hypothetical protein
MERAMVKITSRHAVLYVRRRPSEPFANEMARRQTRLGWEAVEKEGFRISGSYFDDEFVEPGDGSLEHRWGWLAACRHATKVAEEQGGCTLFILRSAGIGMGDPFLPDPQGFELSEDV